RAHDLRVAQALRPDGRRGRQASARPRGRERQAEEVAGGCRPGHRGAQGDQRKKMVSPQVRRRQLALARERGLSQRQARGLLAISRSTLSYELRLPAKDAPVIESWRQHYN